MATGKKNGSVRMQDYQAPAYLQKLEPLVQQLQADIPRANYDAKTLGQLIASILQFMEDALGINGMPPKPFPKIPAKLFTNFSASGPLYTVAKACYNAASQRNQKKIDFTSPAKRLENLEILRQIRNELLQQRYIQALKIYLHPSCGSEISKLTQIVKNLKAETAASESEPGVTHIVYPFGPDGDPDDGEQYLRTLQLRGPYAYVHWWYYPDSYDEWVANSIAPEDLQPDRRPIGPHKVYVRWLTDSEKYNEWMNPGDYETEEFQQEQEEFERAAAASRAARDVVGVDAEEEAGEDEEEEQQAGKRKWVTDANEAADAKKLKVVGVEGVPSEAAPAASEPPPPPPPSGPQPEIEAGGGEAVADGVVKQTVCRPFKAAMDGTATVENISQGQLRGPEGSAAVPQSLAAVPPPEQPKDVPRAGPMKELYRVPAHAAWFEWNKIHDIEMRNVPEFFSGKYPSKTPKVYMEYRNFIINKYREDQHRYLNFTACRSLLNGDVNGILRIWSFLDHWGLINYQATNKPAERQESVVAVQPEAAAPVCGRVVAAPPAPNVDTLFRFPAADVTRLSTAVSTGGTHNSSKLVSRKDIFNRMPVQPPGVEPKFYCNAMPWVDCSAVRYHCTKIPDVDLCPQAYTEGRFPPGCTAQDFIRIEHKPQEDDGGWSDQETLLLLEGLELYGDQWAEIAEHVGTKSQLQCVLHFLQLPIEEQFMDQLHSTAAGHVIPEANAAAPAAPHNEEDDLLIPFADAGNPIMAQVAFLAAMVGPKVAAAAAQKALEVLTKSDPLVQMEVQLSEDREQEQQEKEEDSRKQETQQQQQQQQEEEKEKEKEKEDSGEEAADQSIEAPHQQTELHQQQTQPEEDAGGDEGTAAATTEQEREPEAAPHVDADKPTDDEEMADAVADNAMYQNDAAAELEAELNKIDDMDEEPDEDNDAMVQEAAGTTAADQAAPDSQEAGQPESNPSSSGPHPHPPGTATPEEESEDEDPDPLSATRLKIAAATALSAAAVKAKLLADAEEREIQRVMMDIVDTQMKKIAMKMKYMEQVEEIMERERAALEAARMSLVREMALSLDGSGSRETHTTTLTTDNQQMMGNMPPPIPQAVSGAPPVLPAMPSVSLQQQQQHAMWQQQQQIMRTAQQGGIPPALLSGMISPSAAAPATQPGVTKAPTPQPPPA